MRSRLALFDPMFCAGLTVMRTSVILGVLLAIGGVFSMAVYSEPTGVLAVIAGMFAFILIRS